MSNWKLMPVEPTETQRQSMYMAQHYDMGVINPDEWGAVDKSYAAAVTTAPDPTEDVELVERVAKALYYCDYEGNPPHRILPWHQLEQEEQDLYREMACAALKAIQDFC